MSWWALLRVWGPLRAFKDDDGFAEAIVGALVIGIQEVLKEAEAAFKGRGTVAESAFDGLEEGEAGMGQRHDADTEQPLAGSEAIGEVEEEAEVEDEEEGPKQFEGHIHVELCFGVDVEDNGLVGAFVDVKLVLQDVLQCHLGGKIYEHEQDTVDEKGPESAGEGCEWKSGEGSSEVGLVGIEETGALVEGHENTISGVG